MFFLSSSHAFAVLESHTLYPDQFSLTAINRLERLFILTIEWDMYIKQSVYAK